jgi:hypothetical protein
VTRIFVIMLRVLLYDLYDSSLDKTAGYSL